MRKHYLLVLVSMCSFVLFLCQVPGISQCVDGTLRGNIFMDATVDGKNDIGDPPISSVIVRVYNDQGNFVASGISDGSGQFSISNLQQNEEYRVEVDYPTGYRTTKIGVDHKSDTRFVTTPNCDIAFGLLDQMTMCNMNPDIYITCFVQAPLGTYGSNATIVGVEHNFDPSSPVNVVATKAETGSIWGLTYKKSSDELFSTAFVKQNAALTSYGHDAIFSTQVSSQSTTLFTSLTALGLNPGSLTVSNPMDCSYGAQVGKIGLGAIDISKDEEYLYTINLSDNTLVKIPTSNPTAANTASYSIPNPGCAQNGIARAFAVKYYNDKVYVGVTCTAELTQTDADASIHVFSFNPTTASFGLEFSTSDIRGHWIDTPASKFHTAHWLTDIDFNEKGNMLLALTDRFGHRYCNATNSRVDQQFPDLYMVWNDNGTWKLENNGTVGSDIGTGVGNGEGPGGGEFFGDDIFLGDPATHSETTLGSILVVPGSGEVIASVFDPIYSPYSGGLHRYNTTNGSRTNAIKLYSHDLTEAFGKATGFGDLTARCQYIPPQIGNLVWDDVNQNGLQDAGENKLIGVEICLYDGCSEITRTVTDNDGIYFFNGVNPQNGSTATLETNVSYTIAICPGSYDNTNNSYLIGGTRYIQTNTNSNDILGSDLQSASGTPCPTLNSQGVIEFNIDNIYDINHNLDIGLVAADRFDLALKKEVRTHGPYTYGQKVIFDISVINQGNIASDKITVVDYLNDGFSFIPGDNPGWSLINGVLEYELTDNIDIGQSKTVALELVLEQDPTGLYVNYAEIRTTTDQFGDSNNDIDSTADGNESNDLGGDPRSIYDNFTDGNGSDDEDDHDPAQLDVLDIALYKELRANPVITLGAQLSYDIHVVNQGNVEITDFEVIDYVPAELSLASSQTLTWTPDGNGNVLHNFSGSLLPGQKVILPIRFKLVSESSATQVLNYAEVSSVKSVIPGLKDIDSTPDRNNTDIGAIPNDVTDNLITDKGTIDEDDHDVATFNIEFVDLALRKITDKRTIVLGDTVTFSINVYNQGLVTADNVKLVDHLPKEMTILDPNGDWTLEMSDANFNSYTQTIQISGGLKPAEEMSYTLTAIVTSDFPKNFIINEAEIVDFTNLTGMSISRFDIDSTPDMDLGNDAGGVPGTEDDNRLDGDGSDDEDDHDGALINIVRTSTDGPCVCKGNAINGGDGQFDYQIQLEAPEDSNWYIDYVSGLYTTASVVGAPVSFVTGSAGFTFSASVPVDGYRMYTLDGIMVDGEGFVMRITNGEGIFLNFDSQPCYYDQELILGAGAVCINSLETYSVDEEAGCNYSWSISGGVAVGPTNQASVDIQWGASIGEYDVILTKSNCPGGCDDPQVLHVEVGSADGALACIQYLNIGLGSDCSARITPTMLNESPLTNMSAATVMILDAYGHVIPSSPYVNYNHIGQTLTAKLIDGCSGNSCWGEVTVEDKQPPHIQCDDVVIPCHALDTYRPLAYDNCTTIDTIILVSETVTPLYCQQYLKEVERTYVAIDQFGNTSPECTHTISLERIDMDNISFPDSLLVSDMTALECDEVVYNDNGVPDISITGVPTINGISLYPQFDAYCEVAVDYEDRIILDFGCTKKYMRTWTVYENYCSVGVLKQYQQVIQVEDREDPIIYGLNDMVLNTNGTSCEQTIVLPQPDSITDDCSTTFVIDIVYPGGFIDNAVGNEAITLDAGTHMIKYRAYDECGNVDSVEYSILIKDNVTPVAICDQNSVVALTGEGKGKAFASTFDDGSYDDCSMAKLLVRKMDNICPCERPHFNDAYFLGEYEGHFYYTFYKYHEAPIAFEYAYAYGGYPVTINSSGEGTWLEGKVDSIDNTLAYLIGLNDVNNEGTFVWDSSGQEPGNPIWSGGHPNAADKDFVVVDALGDWQIVDGLASQYAIVFEVSDPCSWSDFVTFCCDEANTDQMVALRAIDYFGQSNNCMASVEIQDKIPPVINCPPDMEVNCETTVDLTRLNELFGYATATDACKVDTTHSYVDNRNQCGIGTIVRTFTAADANGSSECQQVITFKDFDIFDENDITWPKDYLTDKGCNAGDLLPPLLDPPFDYPILDEGFCDLAEATYSDEMYYFINDSDACFKIVRTWRVIDWCQIDDLDYEPWTYQQTIKVNNTDKPYFTSGCGVDTTFCTPDGVCDRGFVKLSATALDSCTLADDLVWEAEIDLDKDAIIDTTYAGVGGTATFADTFPSGYHQVLFTFFDRCGNKSTCTSSFGVQNCKGPQAVCVHGLTVGLEPMDLDGDQVPDAEMACVFAKQLNESSSHPCDVPFTFSFSPDTTDTKITFDCSDCDTNFVTLYVTDTLGMVDACETYIIVQDNNDYDPPMPGACPGAGDCVVLPPADITVANCITDFSPGNIPGSSPVLSTTAPCNEGELTTSFVDVDISNFDENGNCTVFERRWTYTTKLACTNRTETFVQTITILNAGIFDSQITCGADITVDANAACRAIVDIPIPDTTWLCTTGLSLSNSLGLPSTNGGTTVSGTFGLGATDVTFTLEDVCGNSVSCTTTVTVVDNTDPTCNAQDITIALGADGTSTINLAAVASVGDNCGVDTAVLSQEDFDCSDAGTTVPVTITVTDVAGNVSTCVSMVTVNQPGIISFVTANPRFICNGENSDISFNISGGTGPYDIVYTDGTSNFTENNYVSGTDIPVSPATTTTYTIVSLMDNNGCAQVSPTASAIVTVRNNAPVCNASNITLNLGANGQVAINISDVATIIEDCAIVDTTISQRIFDCDDIGQNIVSITITDNAVPPNTTTCTSIVTIIDPNINATISTDDNRICLGESVDLSFNITNGNSPYTVMYSDGTNTITESGYISGTAITVMPTTTTTYTIVSVEDQFGCGATSVSGSIQVIVDPQPAITAVVDVDPLDCDTDNGTITISAIPSTGVEYSINGLAGPYQNSNVFSGLGPGTYNIVVRNQNDTCPVEADAAVVLVEPSRPVINSIADVDATNCAPFNGTITINASGGSGPLQYSIDNGANFQSTNAFVNVSPGTYTIVVTNADGSCPVSQTVVIGLDDDTPPACVAQNVTLTLDANGNAILTVADIDDNVTDNCTDADDLVFNLSDTQFDCTDIGTSNVTYTATDEAGNTSANCPVTLTIVDDITPTCTLNNFTATIGANDQVVVTLDDLGFSVNDNCPAGVTTTVVPADLTFDCSDIGMNTVTVTVEDAAGNSSTCTAIVTVQDVAELVCTLMDITVELDATGQVVLTGADLDDGSSAGCLGGNITFTLVPNILGCNNIGDNTITVTATAGTQTTTCTAVVTVVDNTDPMITCPAAMTIECEADISDLSVFGSPTISDNCEQLATISEDVEMNINVCNIGTIIRTFTVTDPGGNTASCQQILTIEGPDTPITAADISFPSSVINIDDCEIGNVDLGTVTVDESGADCSNVSIAFTDNPPTPPAGECMFTIIRTYTVIDSCQLNSNTGAGIFTFTQTINVNDQTGPVLTLPNNISLPATLTDCTEMVDFVATATDCSTVTITNDSPYSANANSGDASGIYDVGETVVTFVATDACGNSTSGQATVTITGDPLVRFTCEKVITSVPNDVNTATTITQTDHSIVLQTFCQFLDVETSYSSSDIELDTIVVDCIDIGDTEVYIFLWVNGMVIDSCRSLITYNDPNGFCDNSFNSGIIQGRVRTENNVPVKDVAIYLDGSGLEERMTTSQGEYAFPAMPMGGSYVVQPLKDGDDLNGVTTLDLLQIQRHILGLSSFESPYQYIAGDINQDERVTASDLVELRKLILGKITEFPNNTSWRTVDGEFNFADPSQALAHDFPEVYEIDDLQNHMDVEFIGVKIGDLNQSAIANGVSNDVEFRTSTAFEIRYDDQKINKTEVQDIVLEISESRLVEGFQFEIQLDPAYVDILDVKSEDAWFNVDQHINIDHLDSGLISMSWTASDAMPVMLKGDELISITVKAKKDVQLSNVLSIEQDWVKPEAYIDGIIAPIDLMANDLIKQEFVLFQNTPNPWSENTEISFYAPYEGKVELKVLSLSGKLLLKKDLNASLGMNTFLVDKNEVSTNGLMYYEVSDANQKLVRQMILLK